jgi:hypothetical protein
MDILKTSDLAGYRKRPVYIRRSMHVSQSADTVRDVMSLLFEVLSRRKGTMIPAWCWGFHLCLYSPYVAGNGRVGGFLMNKMLASGSYPWTLIPVMERTAYLGTLENASVRQNIRSFAEFLARLVRDTMKVENCTCCDCLTGSRE